MVSYGFSLISDEFYVQKIDHTTYCYVKLDIEDSEDFPK